MNHTFIGRFVLVLFAAAFILSGCKQDPEPEPVDPADERKTTGFVLIGTTEAQDATFAQYVEELPTGTVDLTEGTSFQQFFPLSVVDGAIFLQRTDGDPGFAKIGIDGNGAFVEDGIISTISGESFVMGVRDSDFGLFHDRADANVVNIFNPTTMEVTGTIDMSMANALVDTADVRYQDFIFRGTNEVFAPVRQETGETLDDMPFPKIDISAGRVTDVARFEGLGNIAWLNSTRRHIDEGENLYTFHVGNLSIPTISGAIIRIPSGTSDFDSTYQFAVPEVNNPAVTGFGSFMTGFNYYKDNIGFALVNESLDPRIAELLDERGGFQNLTPEDFTNIQTWLFQSPTGAFVQIDLANQTVTKIEGLPPVSVFDAAGINFINGKPYFAVANPTTNALYEYDEATNSATKVFDVTGANLDLVVDLSEVMN